MSSSTIDSIRYFNWEGDACRVYDDENGIETADIYICGKGLQPIDSTEILFGAQRISEEMYKELVRSNIALEQNQS